MRELVPDEKDPHLEELETEVRKQESAAREVLLQADWLDQPPLVIHQYAVAKGDISLMHLYLWMWSSETDCTDS